LGILVPPEMKMEMSKLLENFAKNNIQTKNAKIIDTHGGSLFVSRGIENHVANGFIAIGDAAVQINPLGGEGIRHALYSARFAANVIDSSLKKKDFSSKFLKIYNTMWKNYVGNKWKTSYNLQKAFSKNTFRENIIDKFVSMLSKEKPETVFNILFNYNFGLKIGIASRLL
jgi:flavin-dependent dehydrogenase